MPLEKVKADYERVVSSYRAKQMEMERSMLDLTKQVHKERVANDVLTAETHSLKALVTQLNQQLDDERKMSMQQKKAFAKLSARFLAVNETLNKMMTVSTTPDTTPTNAANVKSVLNTISKENQDYQRRIKVLETQHMEDKRSLVNSEKKLKAIKMELESIEHMQMTQQSTNDAHVHAGLSRAHGVDGATSTATTVQGKNASQAPVLAGLAPSAASSTPTTVNDSDDPHANIRSILEQYIDPNILRILHKVDSQFSISNAIHLSSTMKRWLHSCHSINTSVDIGVVLQEYVPSSK
ncbi:hypothetical protein DYB32_004106 [Aphanomyces invadans]|uniref:Uncharacterized protein n=1 Tax=Aphanomyces invadans TaxID=157072 RepID=A0A418AYJ7_9STRA|nr:hypothetical protein DYB32_004106 [Aphanomyces invadans]